MNLEMDETNFVLMHKEVAFQVSAKSHLTKCMNLMRTNTFVGWPALAAVKQEEEKKKGEEPSTSTSTHTTPSAPSAAAGPAVRNGGKPKRRRRKVVQTETVAVQTEENVEPELDEQFKLNHLENMIREFIVNLRTIRQEQFEQDNDDDN